MTGVERNLRYALALGRRLTGAPCCVVIVDDGDGIFTASLWRDGRLFAEGDLGDFRTAAETLSAELSIVESLRAAYRDDPARAEAAARQLGIPLASVADVTAEPRGRA